MEKQVSPELSRVHQAAELPVHDTFTESQVTELPDIVYAASVHPDELPEVEEMWNRAFVRPEEVVDGVKKVLVEIPSPSVLRWVAVTT